MARGGVVVLENLRFNAGETSKDAAEREAFAAKLAEFGDFFISDGFGVVHRKQASVYELAKALPSACGLLIEKELEVLTRLTSTPERPYAVVLGGSKVSDKLGVIDHLLPTVNKLLVGGGMVFTFLAALGHKVGSSLLEVDQIPVVQEYLSRAKQLGVEIVLPTDIVVASKFGADAEVAVTAADAIESSPFGASGLGRDAKITCEYCARVDRAGSGKARHVELFDLWSRYNAPFGWRNALAAFQYQNDACCVQGSRVCVNGYDRGCDTSRL